MEDEGKEVAARPPAQKPPLYNIRRLHEATEAAGTPAPAHSTRDWPDTFRPPAWMIRARPPVAHFTMSYRDVLRDADRHFAEVVAAQPANLQCGRGCSFCCYGLFEIGTADVAVLADALRKAPPALRRALVARSRETIERTGHPDIRAIDRRAREAWFETVGEVACPALGEDGLCSIYEDRPMICRTFGLPIREGPTYIGDICELNFTTATEQEKNDAAWDIEQEDPVDDAEQYTIPEAILLADRLVRESATGGRRPARRKRRASRF